MTSKRLKLRKNQASFPHEVFQEIELRSLEIYSEGLENLQGPWEKLCNLTNLSLQVTNLTHIPQNIFEIESLSILKIKNGIIESLPVHCNLPRLKNLQLNNNKLKNLPDWIGSLSHLEHLDLSGNNLDQLPPSFSQLKNLKRLNLDRNKFELMPLELTKLKSLLHLSLDNNPWEEDQKDLIYKQFKIWF